MLESRPQSKPPYQSIRMNLRYMVAVSLPPIGDSISEQDSILIYLMRRGGLNAVTIYSREEAD